MNRDNYLGKIAKYIGRLIHEIRALNAVGRFDINSTTEDFLTPILKAVFTCPELQNQNQIQQNFPAVDLGCRQARVSFQVTTDASSNKIVETLEKFKLHDLNLYFDSVYVIVITEKQSSYASKALDGAISALPILFSKTNNILDLLDILKRINLLGTDKLRIIESHLQNEFEKHDEHSRFRENLDQFLAFSARKIDVEKKSKKYIPDIFIETHSTKEEMRAFVNPLFFYRKVQDTLARVEYRRLNALLALAKEPELALEIDSAILREGPVNYEQLTAWSKAIGEAVEKELVKVRPLSWDREEGAEYTPIDDDSAVWSIVRFKVESVATGLTYRLRDALAVLQLLQKRIFLITSVAGQGKTNFVCDLIENQLVAFQVPCIFIPARELNRHPSHTRILNFISNNRYSPNFNNIHDYLDLFNRIGKDIGRPFVIAIDGVNEVAALEEFSDELKEICGSICQYEFVKIVITCRSEFFNEKYASILNEPYVDQVHRVNDLRAKMSEASKNRLLAAYFHHFEVTGTLAETAKEFLKSDLLLLRIFCERHKKRDIGYTAEIYKGDLFEDYLVGKFQSLPQRLRAGAFPTLTKIAARMLAEDDYAKLSVRDFDTEEKQIVQHLVADDVILRQEIPTSGLASFGDVVVSFTYDELRDFIIAYKLIGEVTDSSAIALEEALAHLPGRPIYEGVYKYAYLLARKADKSLATTACERTPDFVEHFSLNVHLLPPAVQNPDDVRKVEAILTDISIPRRVNRVARFLHGRRNTAETLNITLLINHMNRLEADEHQAFIRTLFSNTHDHASRDWRQNIGNFIDKVYETSSEGGLSQYDTGWIAFFLHAASFALWSDQERAAMLVRSSLAHECCTHALKLVRTAKADIIRSMIAEIEAPEDAG